MYTYENAVIDATKRKFAHKHQIKAIIWILVIILFGWKCYDVTTSYNAWEEDQKKAFIKKEISDEKWVEINKITDNIRQKFAVMDAQERRDGKVELKKVKNDFGGIDKITYTIRSLKEKQSDFGYMVETGADHGVFRLTSGSNSFYNITFKTQAQFEFDGVVKHYTMYLCGYDLCVWDGAGFAEDIKKASTMRVSIPYDTGKQIATFNVTQLKGLVK